MASLLESLNLLDILANPWLFFMSSILAFGISVVIIESPFLNFIRNYSEIRKGKNKFLSVVYKGLSCYTCVGFYAGFIFPIILVLFTKFKLFVNIQMFIISLLIYAVLGSATTTFLSLIMNCASTYLHLRYATIDLAEAILTNDPGKEDIKYIKNMLLKYAEKKTLTTAKKKLAKTAIQKNSINAKREKLDFMKVLKTAIAFGEGIVETTEIINPVSNRKGTKTSEEVKEKMRMSQKARWKKRKSDKEPFPVIPQK